MRDNRPDNNYNQRNEAEYRDEVRKEFLNTHKRNERFIRQSPDGKSWALGVDNAGNTIWTLVP